MPIYTEMVKDKKSGKMVEKLVDGKKQYFIRTYVSDEFGNSKQVTRHNKEWLGREGYYEAQQEEIALKNKKIMSKTHDDIIFKDLFEEKLKFDEQTNKNRDTSRMTYREKMEYHVIPKLGNKIARKITDKDCLNLIVYLKNFKPAEGRRKGKNLSIKYINDIIGVVSSVFEFGIKFYNLKNNPMKLIGKIKEDKSIIKETNPFEIMGKDLTISPDDWKKIANAMEYIISISKDKLREIKKSILLTTEYILLTRVGETQGMKFKNMYFDLSVYVLYEAYNKKTKDMTPTKNGKARILYMPKELNNAFKMLYELEKAEEDFSNNNFIFGKEKPIPRTTIDNFRKKVLKLAKLDNIEYVTNHQLRHAGISNAIYNEIDASAVSDMAGHTKEVMFSTYVQTLKQANTQLVNVLDKIKIPNIKQDQKQDQKQIKKTKSL